MGADMTTVLPVPATTCSSIGAPYCVECFNGTFYMWAESTLMYFSSDGISWSSYSIPTNRVFGPSIVSGSQIYVGDNLGSTGNFSRFTPGGGFVAITQVGSPHQKVVQLVSFSGFVYQVTQGAAVFKSPDCGTWTSVSMPVWFNGTQRLISYQSKVWAIKSGSVYWTSDFVTWNAVSGAAALPKSLGQFVVGGDKVYLVGGWNGSDTHLETYSTQDFITWAVLPTTQKLRSSQSNVAFFASNSFYSLGGSPGIVGVTGSVFDIYRMPSSGIPPPSSIPL